MPEAVQTLHDFRFPGESEEYRRARDELLHAEVELRRQIERVAVQRHHLPPGGAVPTDYEFDEWDVAAGRPKRVRLSELFEGKHTLFLYSFMIVPTEQGLPFVGPCPSCTSIIDGIDGALPHITQRIAFAAIAGVPVEEFRRHGENRGWRHVRQLSAVPSSYSHDYGAADANGYQWPIANVFVQRDGAVHHFWSSELWWVGHDEGQGPRHVDFMWPMWMVFDRTAEGRGTWEPRLEYE